MNPCRLHRPKSRALACNQFQLSSAISGKTPRTQKLHAVLWCAVVGVLDPRGQSDGLLKTACCTNVIKAHGVQFQQSSESTSRPSNLDRTRTALQRRHNEEALLQTVDGDAGSADTATGKRNTRPKGGGLPNDSASTVAQEQLVTWCTTKMLGPDSADAGCRRLTAVLLVPE
jgi:hypothetical protein